ncbi:MAG: multifunctional CCA addition/repair protein [Candidatus Dasytiphilus stammeri]
MKIYLVGGAIRNKCLNLPVKDKDWVIVGATPQEVLKLGFKPVGKGFPVFLHPVTGEEYALARTEKKTGKGYTGFTCYTDPNVSLEQDLQRRDLTINAIACDEKGNYFDPFNGRKDLECRILRHVSNSFREDPLRVLRVARFAACYAHLDFTIANETLMLMRSMSKNGELIELTAERIWKETELALQSYNPQLYFQVLKQCNALEKLFPELESLYKINSSKLINMGIHTLRSLFLAAQLSTQMEIRFATLCHNFGKLLNTKMASITTPALQIMNHSSIFLKEDKLIKNFCQRLRVPNYLQTFAILANKFHSVVHHIKNLQPCMVIQLFNYIDAWRKPYRIEQLSLVSEVNARAYYYPKKILYSQGEYLRILFQIAKKISVQQIIEKGFQGIKINQELSKLRCQKISKWKKQQLI